MRVSLNWLKQYVDISISPEELADRLTMVGLEVENIERLGEKYNKFVVGKVLEVKKHPKANRLTVCKVDIGSEILQIVCGAPNVVVSQKIPVGLIGATVPRNQHDPDGKPFLLNQAKIRDIDSFGMICSGYELELNEDKEGIMVLDTNAVPGTSFADYLGLIDVIFEIGITPNRPDAMSHIGIAREISAILHSDLKYPKFTLNESTKNIKDCAIICVEDTINCPRYVARVVFNIKLTSSPKWLQENLKAVGTRPVNNVVDITNYVLMECGHPLHAFDYDKIKDHKIIVRSAQAAETITTIDHKIRNLRSDTLMICDSQSTIAIAGVMGGENTEVSESTSNILIESAYFNPQSIRRTAKYFGLNTDASQRFERGADPNIAKWAVDRASQLVHDICGGEIVHGVIDVYPKKIQEKEIELRCEKLNQLLGTSLSSETISDFLKKFQIEIIRPKTKPNSWNIAKYRIPTFRPDLEREIDLIEEVTRAYGYDNIHNKISAKIVFTDDTPRIDFVDELSTIADSAGFNEIVTNSMQDISIASLVSDKSVKISNPISKDMASLRTSLIPGVLEIIRHNIFHGTKNIRLFDIGKVYTCYNVSRELNSINGYLEEDRIIFAMTGLALPQTWDQKPRFIDVFDIKGEIQGIFSKIFLDNVKFIPYSTTDALSECALSIEINGNYVGLISAIRRDILDKFDIEQEVYVSELNIQSLKKNKRLQKRYDPLPKYPAVMRDIAFVIDETLPVGRLTDEVEKIGYPLLKKLELFDIYTGDQLETGRKSCAYALEFMSKDHTLKQEEIDQVMQSIIEHVTTKLNATIRN